MNIFFNRVTLNFILFMKLFVILIFCTALFLHAESGYSQEERIHLTVNNVKVSDVLKEIESQTNYLFFYNHTEIGSERAVSLDAADVPLNSLLNRMFKNTDVDYVIVGKHIVLTTNKQLANMAVAVQGITITGTITDEAGEPLPGVNVVIKGTATGVVTGFDGKYSINVPNRDAALVFSFMGYTTQELVVGSRNDIDIMMSENVQEIEEVVVIGYGIQKKATMAGSVVAVESKELITTKNTNVQNMLTGKLAGVRNIQKTSEPGEFTNQFDIRGMGSPLIVVDGVPRGEVPRMDPNDIESISILKDASAAIYGIRGANGVVLITTKSGEKGKAKIEYSGYYGLQTPAELLRPVDAYNRALVYNEATMRSLTNPRLEYGDDYFERLENGEEYNTDWYDLVLKKTAPQQQHNISVSGGSDKIDYFVNFGYTSQGSFFATNSSNYHRYNVRTNLNAQITNRLKVGVRLSMMMDENNRQNIGSSEIFKALWRMRPNDPVYANDTEPYYVTSEQVNHPLALIDTDLGGSVKNKKNMFQSNFTLEYDVPYIKGLTTSALYSYDRTWDDNSNFRKQYYTYSYNAVDNTYTGKSFNSPTWLERYYGNSYATLWNVRLNYDDTYASVHHVSAIVAYEERYSDNYNFRAQREFTIPIPYLFAGSSVNQVGTGSGINENAFRSVIGRLNYEYAGKYLAEFSFRSDGSSKFPPGSQWGFFPSVLLGYRISEENFFKNSIPFVQNLKIRGSWGRLGDESASNFEFVEGYDYPRSGGRANIPTGYVFGDTFVNGLGFRNAPNMYLTWYTATTMNIGIDADMLNGLFGFSLDLFQRDRDGLMASPSGSVPATFGAGIANANLNADRIRGFEIELRHRNKISDFRYNVTAFVQMTRSMWTAKAQVARTNSYDYWRNYDVDRYKDVWFGLGGNGQFQSYEQIANSIYAGSGTLPGDPVYEDWNGDGVIDDLDRHPIATTTSNNNDLPGDAMINARNYPLMNFAVTLGGQWKWIDFNFLFQGAALSYIGQAEQLAAPLAWNGNALEMMLDRWHPADSRKDPYDPSNEWVSGRLRYGNAGFDQNSTFNIQKANYMRLKSIEVGFTIPQNIVFRKIGIKNLRLYFNSYNLFTITGVKGGMDPEKPSETYGYLYPLNRSFNFGGSITF
jgi:TonB-linked SusC/RagA family outer membrane protein